MMIKNGIQPELKDIIEAINRYAVVNKNDVVFVGLFVVFDKEKVKNGKEDIIKDHSDRLFAYGDKETLLTQLHTLMGLILESEDEFINW